MGINPEMCLTTEMNPLIEYQEYDSYYNSGRRASGDQTEGRKLWGDR